jgi:hypothetical protein
MTGRRWFAVVALGAVAMMSCARGENTGASASLPPAATAAATPCSVEGASMDSKRSESTAPTALVTDVRYKAEGCPRIVFEFRDQESGYKIGYADPPFSECGSGEAVSTEGWGASAFVTVQLQPAASADIDAEGAPPTYTGPRDIRVSGNVLKHLKVICDFEADFSWLVGLDARHAFAVTTLDDPSRIVIDISQT